MCRTTWLSGFWGSGVGHDAISVRVFIRLLLLSRTDLYSEQRNEMSSMNINTGVVDIACHRHPTQANYGLFRLFAQFLSNTLLVSALLSGEREQDALTRHLSGSYRSLRGSLCHKPVPKAAPGASWLPHYRKCSRASVTAMAQVYRVEKAVWLVPH